MIEINASMPSFSLDSTSGDTVSSEDRVGKPMVVLFGTQYSMKTVDKWYDELQESFEGTSLVIAPIAVLNALPAFVPPSAVKVRIKKKVRCPALLDMKGTVAEAFGITGDTAQIIVVDADHTVRLTSDELNEAVLNTIKAALELSPIQQIHRRHHLCGVQKPSKTGYK